MVKREVRSQSIAVLERRVIDELARPRRNEADRRSATFVYDVRVPRRPTGRDGRYRSRILGGRDAPLCSAGRRPCSCRGIPALLLAAFGALGVPLLLLAEIEAMEPSQRRVTFTTGLAVTSVVVLTSAIGTMALSPFLGKSLRLIGQDPATAGLFIVGAVATMAGLTLDNLAIGLLRGDAQLWRGSLSSILKLACVGALVLASTRTSKGLIFAWALALVASFVLCLPMLGLERTHPGEGSLSHRVASCAGTESSRCSITCSISRLVWRHSLFR